MIGQCLHPAVRLSKLPFPVPAPLLSLKSILYTCIFLFHSLLLYYFRSMALSLLQTIETLKDQLALVCQ